ncbi:hypothetical protein P4305_18895 [Bacillus thuringiensis]|nr:hypothetical protein [Bacillus thuringiensis]
MLWSIYINGNYVAGAETISKADLLTDAYISKYMQKEVIKEVRYIYEGGI